MIYITGDTHIPIDIGKLSTKRFPEQKQMSDTDFLIICGDFGGVWCGDNEEKYWLKWLNAKNFTTLFIDGNHENFDMLKEYPEVDYCGGKAQKIKDKIYHLMRGQIYNIDGKKYSLSEVLLHMIKILGKKERIGGKRNFQQRRKLTQPLRILQHQTGKLILS